MATIGIMTWLHNGNYGTVLQAYALQRFLRNCGYDVKNIDFNVTASEKVKNLIGCGNSPKLFLEKFDMARMKKAADPEKLRLREERFREFLRCNLNLTKRISTYEELKDYADAFDAYICGSDQIWSPALLNPPYYFDFVVYGKKKIAYSCSFGVSCIPDKKKSIIRSFIKRYDHISVREHNGQKIVKDLLGIDVPTTVDPVFLLSKEDWNMVASEEVVKPDYVFAYFLTYNKTYIETAIKTAEQLGVKLVMVPATREEYRINAELVQDAGPAEWVSLIKDAKVVLTDSFHGCVFSLIYGKPLLIFKRFSDESKGSQNSRIYTLVEQYGLERSIAGSYDPEQVERVVQEKGDVKALIEKNAAWSKSWLEAAISE